MKELYGVVLMYLDGYKVSEDDFGDLWCSEVPEEYVTPGDGVVIEGSAFIPSGRSFGRRTRAYKKGSCRVAGRISGRTA